MMTVNARPEIIKKLISYVRFIIMLLLLYHNFFFFSLSGFLFAISLFFNYANKMEHIDL